MNHDPLSIPGLPARTAATTPTLVFRNANVITLHPEQPVATQVAIADGRIRWVGGPEGLGLGAAPAAGARIIDLGGRTVLPAFNDAHIHLLSLAATLWSVDCGPGQGRSIRDIQRLIAGQARRTRPGEWVRAFGYDEAALEERRHPNRADLDEAARGVPVRLIHRSGHASVLNTAGLDEVGLRGDAPDPETGYIERDPLTGQPTGFLVDMEERLAQAAPRPPYELVRDGLAQASRCLVSRGVASVQDATVKNDVERWNLFQRVKADGVFAPHITFMPGINHLGAFAERGLGFGARSGGLRIGHAKIVAALANGGAQPSADDLTRLAAEARAAGYPVAIHAIEAEVVAAAIRAIRDAKSGDGARDLRDRIEHASELPDELLPALRQSRIQVVTQPSFLYFSGDRYLAEVAPDRRSWLYRSASLFAAGIAPPAAGSDAPVAPANPLRSIYAAITRRSQSGAQLSPEEGVAPLRAVEMHTRYPAAAAHEEKARGAITPGMAADLVVLDRNPLDCPPDEIPDIRVHMTVVGGHIAWEGG